MKVSRLPEKGEGEGRDEKRGKRRRRKRRSEEEKERTYSDFVGISGHSYGRMKKGKEELRCEFSRRGIRHELLLVRETRR